MKYQKAFDSNNAPFDPDIAAKVDKVFEYVISELREKFGVFDKRGEKSTLQRCKEDTAPTLVKCSLEWRDNEGLISMLPRAEMELAEALEEVSLHQEPTSWPKGVGLKHNLRYNPCNWFRAKCVAVFWQLEVGFWQLEDAGLSEYLKILIEKQRQLFPGEFPGIDIHILWQCKDYSRWWKKLESSPASPEKKKEKVREEIAKLEAETARHEAKYLRFFPPPGKDMESVIIRDEEGNERREERKALPPYDGYWFKRVSFKNAVLEDFLLALLPDGQEGLKREIEAKRKRRELAHRLAREVLKEHPETEIFGDEQSVHWVHFPILEEAFRDFTRLRKDAYSEKAFREKLREKLEALEADTAEKLRLYNPEEARPFTGTIGLPKDFHKERQSERMDYLMALFRNTLLAKYLTALFPDDGQPEAGKTPPQEEKPTTKVWALYYWYLQEAGLFDEFSKGRMKAFKELSQKHGISEQNFYQNFNAIGREANEKNPKRNPENIEKVIPLLEEHPEAQQLAIDELAKMKKDFTG